MTNFTMRAQDSFRQGVLFGEELTFCTVSTEGPALEVESPSLALTSSSTSTPWRLEVSVGTRDTSKHFLGIVAFDSEL